VLLLVAVVAALLVAFAVNQWDRSRESTGLPNRSRRFGMILLLFLLPVAGWLLLGLTR
jgi:ABC-type amino acid transport system permease subunit